MIFLAFFFRLNKVLVIIVVNISLLSMIPVIIFASYKMGALWMHEPGGNIDFSKQFSLETIRYNLQQYIYGSISLAILAGVLCSLTSFALLKMFRKKLPTAVQNQ